MGSHPDTSLLGRVVTGLACTLVVTGLFAVAPVAIHLAGPGLSSAMWMRLALVGGTFAVVCGLARFVIGPTRTVRSLLEPKFGVRTFALGGVAALALQLLWRATA